MTGGLGAATAQVGLTTLGVMPMVQKSMMPGRGGLRPPQRANLGRSRVIQQNTRIPAVIATAQYDEDD
jgi:hypothetical protein